MRQGAGNLRAALAVALALKQARDRQALQAARFVPAPAPPPIYAVRGDPSGRPTTPSRPTAGARPVASAPVANANRTVTLMPDYLQTNAGPILLNPQAAPPPPAPVAPSRVSGGIAARQRQIEQGAQPVFIDPTTGFPVISPPGAIGGAPATGVQAAPDLVTYLEGGVRQQMGANFVPPEPESTTGPLGAGSREGPGRRGTAPTFTGREQQAMDPQVRREQLALSEQARIEARRQYQQANALFARDQALAQGDGAVAEQLEAELLEAQLGRPPTEQELAQGIEQMNALPPATPQILDADEQQVRETGDGYAQLDATVVYWGGESNEDTPQSFASVVFELLDAPRQAVVTQVGGWMHSVASDGQGSVSDALFSNPLLGDLSDAIGFGPGDMLAFAQDHADEINQAYTYGYDADGDGKADYTGDRAVWEYFAGQQNLLQRTLYDLSLDPLNYLGLTRDVGNVVAATGRSLAEEAGPLGRGVGAVLRGAGTALAVPNAVVNRPVDAAFEGIGRAIGDLVETIPGRLGRSLETTPRSQAELDEQLIRQQYPTYTARPVVEEPITPVSVVEPQGPITPPGPVTNAPVPPPATVVSGGPETTVAPTPEAVPATVVERAGPNEWYVLTDAGPDTPGEFVSGPHPTRAAAEAAQRTTPAPSAATPPPATETTMPTYQVDADFGRITPEEAAARTEAAQVGSEPIPPRPESSAPEPAPWRADPPTTFDQVDATPWPVRPRTNPILVELATRPEAWRAVMADVGDEAETLVRTMERSQPVTGDVTRAARPAEVPAYDAVLAEGDFRAALTDSVRRHAPDIDIPEGRTIRQVGESGAMRSAAGGAPMERIIVTPWEGTARDRQAFHISNVFESSPTQALANPEGAARYVRAVDLHAQLVPGDLSNPVFIEDIGDAERILQTLEDAGVELPATRVVGKNVPTPDAASVAVDVPLAVTPTPRSAQAVGFANVPSASRLADLGRRTRAELDRVRPGYAAPGEGRPMGSLAQDAPLTGRRILGEAERAAMDQPWLSGEGSWFDYLEEQRLANEARGQTTAEATEAAIQAWKTKYELERNLGSAHVKSKMEKLGDVANVVTAAGFSRDVILYNYPNVVKRVLMQTLSNPITLWLHGYRIAAIKALNPAEVLKAGWRAATKKEGMTKGLEGLAEDLGLAGSRRPVGVGLADPLAGAGRTTPQRWLGNTIGRLPGAQPVTDAIGAFFASPRVRDIANAMDNLAREVLAENGLRSRLRGMQQALVDSSTEYASRNRLDSSVIEDAIRGIEGRAFTPNQVYDAVRGAVKRAGGSDADAFRAARRVSADWANLTRRAMDEVGQEVQHALFANGSKNIEQALSRVFLFTFFMSRATVNYTREALKRPGLTRAVWAAWQSDEAEGRRRNGPKWLQNYLAFVNASGPVELLFEPTALLSTYLFFRDQASSPEDASWLSRITDKSGLMLVPGLEFLANAAGYMGDDNPPDYFGTSSLRALFRNGVNLLNSFGMAPPGGPMVADYYDTAARKIRAELSGFLPGSENIAYTPAGGYQQFAFNAIIWEVARGNGWTDDQIARDLALPNSRLLDPDGDVYQEAYDRYAQGHAAEQGARMLSPVPVTGQFQAPQDLQAVENGEAIITEDGEIVPIGPAAVVVDDATGPVQAEADTSTQPGQPTTDPAATLFNKPEGWNPYSDGLLTQPELTFLRAYKAAHGVWLSPEDIDALWQRRADTAASASAAVAGSDVPRELEGAFAQLDQVGTERGRFARTQWGNIAYGGITGRVVINGRAYDDTSLTAAFGAPGSDARREAADVWVQQHGFSADLDAQREAVDAFKTAHPQYADYTRWVSEVSDYEGGPMAWWRQTASMNPSADQYWREVVLPENNPHAQQADMTNSNAYYAVLGARETVYDENQPPISETGGGTVATATGNAAPGMLSPDSGDSGGGGGGSSQSLDQRIAEDLAEYQRDAAIVNAILGTDYNNLAPIYQQAADYQLQAMGMSPPSLSTSARGYIQWASAQPSGYDTSIGAYVRWYDANQVELQAMANQYLDQGYDPSGLYGVAGDNTYTPYYQRYDQFQGGSRIGR